MADSTQDAGDLIVEVAYATCSAQALVTLKMPAGATVEEAVKVSGILQQFADIDLTINPVGILGQVCSLEQTIKSGDRIEIYRPLRHDPKESRRQRAVKK